MQADAECLSLLKNFGMELASAFFVVHWFSIILATMSAFLIGGIWYGPLFGKSWMQSLGLTEGDLKNRNGSKTFGIAIVLSFIAAPTLAMFIGSGATASFGRWRDSLPELAG